MKRWTRWLVLMVVALSGCADGCGEKEEAEETTPETVKMQFGTFHACVLDDASHIWCVGKNGRGQLGNGSTSDQSQLTQVYGAEEMVGLSVGYFDVTCGWKEGGEVYCWGNNEHGLLGRKDLEMSSVPLRLEGLPAVREVALGADHACALTREGEVYCWGSHRQGQLGLGAVGEEWVRTPTRVEGLEGVKSVQVGAEYSCALNGDGGLYCWGTTVQGQVGAEVYGELYVDEPHRVAVEDEEAMAMAVGFDHACALFGERRQLYCWGRNRYGQLGVGDLEPRNAPTEVAEMAYVDEVAVATGQSCARIEEEVFCTGEVFVDAGDIEAGGPGTYFTASHALRHARELWTGVVGICGPAPAAGGDAVACRGVQRSDDWYGE